MGNLSPCFLQDRLNRLTVPLSFKQLVNCYNSNIMEKYMFGSPVLTV